MMKVRFHLAAFATCLGAILVMIPHRVMADPVQGRGATNCSEYLKLQSQDPRIGEETFFAWAQGFMSATNLIAMSVKKPPRDLGIQIDAQKSALRDYCLSNPTKLYLDAVQELYPTLPQFPAK
jgi:hypothetical protein